MTSFSKLKVRSAADELLAIGRLGSVPTRKDVGRVQSCGSPPILRLVDQAITRALRPIAPSHGERVPQQALDDAPHGCCHTVSRGWTAHPCRQLIVEVGDARLRQNSRHKFRIRRIGSCRGGARSHGPWSSWEIVRVTQSSSRPNEVPSPRRREPDGRGHVAAQDARFALGWGSYRPTPKRASEPLPRML